jgi:hypothetical protein
MRKLVMIALAAIAFTGVVALPARAGSGLPTGPTTSSKLSMTAKIASFRATAAGVVGSGTLTGKLRSGTRVSRNSAPVRFAVVAKPRHGRCNVVTLRLAPLDLELLGVQVTTSHISLDVYALKGRVLGDLFCALSHAKVKLPRIASVAHALNKRLDGRSLFTTSQSLPASTAQAPPQTCQVLKLVLGPLHLDLLGLVVDLYGKTRSNPVIVTINAQPNKGLLGQLLCGLAGGGTGVSTIGGLQSLLNSLGLSLTTTQIQNLLSQLGINLSGGLTQLELQHILQALGLGTKGP